MTRRSPKKDVLVSIEQIRETYYPEEKPSLPYFLDPAPETREEVAAIPIQDVVERILAAGQSANPS